MDTKINDYSNAKNVRSGYTASSIYLNLLS